MLYCPFNCELKYISVTGGDGVQEASSVKQDPDCTAGYSQTQSLQTEVKGDVKGQPQSVFTVLCTAVFLSVHIKPKMRTDRRRHFDLNSRIFSS